MPLRAFAPIHRRTSIGLVAHSFDRHSDFFDRFGIGGGLLRVRSTRASPAHMDETDVAPSVPARAWHRPLSEQRPRGPGSDL